MTDRNQDKKDDFIFGLRPVIEAVEAGKTIDTGQIMSQWRN